MKEYIDKGAFLEAVEDEWAIRLNWTDSEAEIQEQIDWREFLGMVKATPAADVVEVKRGRCKFCGGEDNAFHIINAETVAYSGIEIAINRQGMLRVRVYDDYECETALPRSSEIVMIAACPNCGADMREVDHAETD